MKLLFIKMRIDIQCFRFAVARMVPKDHGCFTVFGFFPTTTILLISMVNLSATISTEPKISIEAACFLGEGKHHCIRKNDYNESQTAFPTLDGNNTFVFNDDEQEIVIEISCVAPYPVEWTHFQEQVLTNML